MTYAAVFNELPPEKQQKNNGTNNEEYEESQRFKHWDPIYHKLARMRTSPCVDGNLNIPFTVHVQLVVFNGDSLGNERVGVERNPSSFFQATRRSLTQQEKNEI